tara:strand:+ start:7957 stop:8907 length:951 start_codon:yes stop_codon:yes gene_type:complete
MNKIIIRQGSVKDIDSILELFNREIPNHWTDKPRDFWIWTNEYLSNEQSIISIAECEDRIIGYYCIIPKLLKIDNKLVKVGMGIHAVIDSDFKKDVSIMEVTNLAYRIAKESDIKMIYGFPNNNYYLIQEKLERWNKVQIYNSIETEMTEKFDTSYQLKEVDIKYDMNIKDDELVSIDKDISYYHTRYIKHPRSLYKSFYVIDEITWDVVGLLITKIFNSEKGHIIDFIIDGKVSHKDIIKLSNNYFIDKGITNLSVWPTSIKFKEAIHNLYDNCYDGFNTNFYVKFLDEDFKMKYKDEITNINNWNLPMGESDAF